MFELIFLLLIGLMFNYMGWLIWKKERITLIHHYHYSKVIEKDKKSYTEKMGKACIVMGTGMILTGAVDYITNSMYGWIFFGISFISGLIIMTFAQLKYNGGII